MGKRISRGLAHEILPNLIGIHVIGFYRILLESFNLTCGLYFLFRHKALIALSILLFSVLNGLALRKIYVILFVLLALLIWKMIIKVFFLNIMMIAAWHCGWLALLLSFVILSSLLIISNYFFSVNMIKFYSHFI